MKTLLVLIRRNIQLFFKDKGMFFTSLITPLILLLLFVTFLGNVYRSSIQAVIPQEIAVPDSLIEGFVGSWLFSSLLAVCCVTIAFCSNMLMVQDKAVGVRADLTIAPVGRSTLAWGYYIASALSTLLICLVTSGACLLYLSQVGWYLSAQDIVLALLDVGLLVTFGTALSSIINYFLSSQGQMAAVSTIVSSCYGFLCGAYMPISQFSDGIQKFVSFLPGTYGTALLRNHLMHGVLDALQADYLPADAVDVIRQSFDSELYFFDHAVTTTQMYLVLGVSVVLLIAGYVLLNVLGSRKKTA